MFKTIIQYYNICIIRIQYKYNIIVSNIFFITFNLIFLVFEEIQMLAHNKHKILL